MRELPDGFEFHKGFDGLIVGLSIIFIVRIEMVISSFIDWQLIPDWSYEPILNALGGIKQSFITAIDSLRNPFGANGDGNGLGFDLGAAAEVAVAELPISLPEALQVVGLPLLFFGNPAGVFLRQVLIIIGFWIAVLIPLWAWVLKPTLFWWREHRAD